MHEILGVQVLQFVQLNGAFLTIWSAIISTVLRLNFLSHIKKRSSKLGPKSSITIKSALFSWPTQYTRGKPTFFSNNLRTFDYEIS
jgi:hypothetical protein